MSNSDLFSIPKLGFGLMRLPLKGDEIDIPHLCNMVDSFMENGFTYFDTAYVYHSGKSEVAIKEALVSRYPRESFQLATKLPGWLVKSKEDVQRLFDEQLERTGAGYFDFYLLHCIDHTYKPFYDKYNCWEWALKLKEKGLIRHFGFSFHDDPEFLDSVLTEHPEIEFVQLQINYIDWDNKLVNSGKCYEIARKHNKPIVIMEPVKGGTLASLNPKLDAKLKAVAPDKSIASWAMRFCTTLEGVMVVLSGMSNEEQMQDNLKTMKDLAPFTAEEKACLDEVTKEYLSAPNIGCTACKYCVDGCPMEIKIPDVIRAYNTVLTYGEHVRPHMFYDTLTKDGHTASTCIACGQCESACPQHLEIISILEKSAAIFDK